MFVVGSTDLFCCIASQLHVTCVCGIVHALMYNMCSTYLHVSIDYPTCMRCTLILEFDRRPSLSHLTCPLVRVVMMEAQVNLLEAPMWKKVKFSLMMKKLPTFRRG